METAERIEVADATEDEVEMGKGQMTREAAVAVARELWGPRGDSVRIGKSCFLGVQRSRHEWDWRAHGTSWEEAVADARRQKEESAATSATLKEKFARVPVRVDGNKLIRDWHGKQYEVEQTETGFVFAGTEHSSLTAIAKIITGARSISGPRFFGLSEPK